MSLTLSPDVLNPAGQSPLGYEASTGELTFAPSDATLAGIYNYQLYLSHSYILKPGNDIVTRTFDSEPFNLNVVVLDCKVTGFCAGEVGTTCSNDNKPLPVDF